LERFYSYSDYLKGTFGDRTYKVVVNSGLTCPTRDGTLGKKACAFCDVRGSSSYYGKIGRGKEVRDQLEERIPRIRERFGSQRFLAYFQSYTNTYTDSVTELRELYEAALSHPEVQGLCIGTRPDCLPPAVLELLRELSEKTYVSLELGVQSFEDPTLEWLDRGHDAECSRQAIQKLRTQAPRVDVGVHLIFGSPTDSKSAPELAAQEINRSGAHGVKLHQLMVLERTELARRWREEEQFPVLSLEEYADQVGRFLSHLNPQIYVERLCATSSHPEECIAPEWSKLRWEPLNFLNRWLEEKQIRQGSRFTSS
jgi:radical SAM protein (TIGR01212 family)